MNSYFSDLIRTDLAVEARQLYRERTQDLMELPGVRARERTVEGFHVDVVEVLDERGEETIGKPVGRYVTLDLDALFRREDSAFSRGVKALSVLLRDFPPDRAVFLLEICVENNGTIGYST